jgi:hypothetical protein
MGSSGSKEVRSASEALAHRPGATRQQIFRDVIAETRRHKSEVQANGLTLLDALLDDLLGKDYFELFELERYADMDDNAVEGARQKRKLLLLRWAPDKNMMHDEPFRKKCGVLIDRVNTAWDTLSNPENRRRYEEELCDELDDEASKKRKEEKNRAGFWSWTLSGACLVAGGCLIAAACLNPVTFAGVAVAKVGIAGSAFLGAGVRCCLKMYNDPNCSATELIKDAAVGAVQGLATGTIGAACAAKAAVAGVAAGAKIAIAATCGATSYAASHAINDGCDLLITNGCLTEKVKKEVTDSKTTDEVFSMDNGVRFVTGTVIGAAAGAAVQKVANAFAPKATSNASALVDDVVTVTASNKNIHQAALDAMEAAKNKAIATTTASLNTTKEAVKNLTENTLTNIAKNSAANCAGTAVGVGVRTAVETGIATAHEMKKGKSFQGAIAQVGPEMCKSGGKQFLVGATISVAAGTLQHYAQRNALQHSANRTVNQLESRLEELKAGDSDCTGHCYERHVGTLDMIEARAKVLSNQTGKVSPSTAFVSKSEADSAIARFTNMIDTLDTLRGNEYGGIIVPMKSVAGYGVRSVNGQFEYTECTSVRFVYRPTENNPHSLVTAYPVPGDNTVWSSVRPSGIPLAAPIPPGVSPPQPDHMGVVAVGGMVASAAATRIQQHDSADDEGGLDL